MGRNGKIKVSVVVALLGLALVVVGGAWAYTRSSGERVGDVEKDVAMVKVRVTHLEEAVEKIDDKLDSGFKGIIEALKKE
ncbi:MAG: hypothetical protein ACYTBJ_01645 [Planctomycetota bacterium]|jgi:hypothetical protein